MKGAKKGKWQEEIEAELPSLKERSTEAYVAALRALDKIEEREKYLRASDTHYALYVNEHLYPYFEKLRAEKKLKKGKLTASCITKVYCRKENY